MMESLCLTEEMVDCTLTAGRTSFSAHRMVMMTRILPPSKISIKKNTGLVHVLTLLPFSLCLCPLPPGDFHGLCLNIPIDIRSTTHPTIKSTLFKIPPKHPVIFVRDVEASILELLVRYMYSGQVTVDNISPLLSPSG